MVVALAGSLAACGGGSQAASIGTTYTDPEGAYTLQVDPAWDLQVGGFAEGVEIWFLGPVEGGFRPNVNLLTQSAPGMDLAGYTAASIRSAPSAISDFQLVSSTRIEPELGVMEYRGTAQGRHLHFLAIFGIRSGRATIATLTSPEETFAGWRATVEPFLRTLRLT